MKACRKIAYGVGNACHEDMVGWRTGIPRTADGRQKDFRSCGHSIVRNATRFNICLPSSVARLAHESRGGSESYADIAPEVGAIAIFSYISSRRSCKARSNLRFNRIKTMVVLETHASNDLLKRRPVFSSTTLRISRNDLVYESLFH